MKSKFISVLFALVLVLSMSLVTAVPAMPVMANGVAQTLNVANWTAPTQALADAVRPTVLLDGTTYHMWYVSNKVVYHTSSSDPAVFSTGTAVTGLVTGYQDCAFVMKEGDTYYMLNYGDDTEKVFSIFTSSNGTDWTAKGKIYDGTGLSNWVKIDRPMLLKETDGYKMYFQVKSNETGNPYYIYLTTTTQTSLAAIAATGDTIDFTLVGTTPVLSPSTSEWDGLRVMQPMVVKDGSNYYMWYVGYTGTNPAKIGFAFSSDGVNWTKGHGNPILAGTTAVWTPSVLKVGSTYHMWNQWDTTPQYTIQYISANAPIQFSTIQAAINATLPGDTINVAAGTYDEQVVIDKSLTLQGTGDTTVVKPSLAAKLTQHFGILWAGATKEIAGIIVANGVAGVTVKNLKVDGESITALPAGANWVAGIFLRETGGTVDMVSVVGTGKWTPDRAYGVYLYAAGASPVSVEVKGCGITNYDKNGINAQGSKLTANIHHNTVIGRGPLPDGDEVQNGILIIDNATATVNNNTVSNNAYTPATWVATGVTFCNAGGSAQSNTLTNNQTGIAGQVLSGFGGPPYTWSVSMVGNTVNASGLSVPSTGGLNAATYISGATLDVTMEGNQLTGGPGDGIYIGDIPTNEPAGSVVATIRNNTISNWQHGIHLVSSVGDGSTITNNIITNNVSTGSGIHIDAVVNAANVKVNYNNILGNQTYGVNNLGTGTLDASKNWWGDISGPKQATTNPGGKGNSVSNNVNYEPWLTREFATVLADNIAYFGEARVHLNTGWNTFSTPIALDPAADTWGKYIALGDGLNIHGTSPAYSFNSATQIWVPLTPTYQLKPCDAIYVRMAGPDIAPILYSPNLSAPTKPLYPGWNLVGLAKLEDMAVNQALTSVYKVAGDLTGYSQVVSPALGCQEAWAFVRDGGSPPNMHPTCGYWVFMVNAPSGTNLAGFTFTPMRLP